MQITYRALALMVLSVVTTTLAMSSCEERATMGRPVFSCGYANFAWKPTAFGHVLDDRGQIWFYDLGTTWSPQAAGDGLYLETALRQRFKNPVLQARRVPSAQLATMRKKAELARFGQIEKKQVAFDAGGRFCEAFVWETPDAYREVKLGTTGNFEVRNSSPEAEQLQRWLLQDLAMGDRPSLAK